MNSKNSNSGNTLLWVFTVLSGLIIYHACFDIRTLLPTNTDWLMVVHHDWGGHYLAWYFYQIEDWTFPIGHISKYYYPLGTNIGLTDSIPLPALFLKIFSGILPEHFQYYGVWLLGCIVISSIYTILILKRLKVENIYIYVIVLFVACNPVLIYRMMHPALSTHWLFLASIYYYMLASDPAEMRKGLSRQYVILLLSSLINPYICLIIMAFTVAIPLRHYLEKNLSLVKSAVYVVGSFVSIAILWLVVGMVSLEPKEDLGVQGAYGLYGMNLNSLYNAGGFSTMTPTFKWVSWHQYEGFMYLGVGMMGLVAISFLLLGNNILQKKSHLRKFLRENKFAVLPIAAVVIGFAFFAITHVISLNEEVLFQVWIPSVLKKAGDVFRASGRFFWLPYYVLVIGSLAYIAKAEMSRVLKVGILLLGFVVQILDIHNLLTHRTTYTTQAYDPPIQQDHWRSLISKFDNVVMYPPFMGTYLTSLDYQDFSYIAAEERKNITTGYVSRVDNRGGRIVTDSLDANLSAGILDEKALYVTTAAYLNTFSFALQSGNAKLNTLDNYYYLYSSLVRDSSVVNLSQRLNALNKQKLDSVLEKFGASMPPRKMEPAMSTDKTINYNFDKYNDDENFALFAGWAFTPTSQGEDSILVFIQSDEGAYLLGTTRLDRPDVADHFKNPALMHAGFSASIDKNLLPKGKYSVGIAIKDSQGKMLRQLTNRNITVGASAVGYQKIESPIMTTEVSQNVDVLERQGQNVKIAGWAHFKGQDTDGSIISVVLNRDADFFEFPTEAAFREDVTAYFKNGFNLDNSGYSLRLKRSLLPPGEYEIGIRIKDLKRNKEGLFMTGRKINL